jgi:serine/threonine protein kinase
LNHGDNLAEVENWLRTVPASSLTVQDGTAGQKDRSRVYKMPPVATRNKADTILEQYDGYDIGSMLVKVGRLGRGSGGTVWQATFDNGRHRVPVAVKEVLVAAEEEEKREMVVHEMKTLYQIQHPCIVNCYKVFLSNSIFSMVMELVNGGSLLDLMKAAPEVIPQDAVGAVCSSVLHALSHLHDENMIMHRDVKPGNILVSVDGEVKLADLGVCTRPGEESTTKWVGTATYMSPERLMGDEYTNAADVWSAGLVVAEAVMGMYPYVKHTKGGSLEFWDLLDMLTSGPSTASILTEANCGASEDLIDFVAATTNRDASLRPRASQALAHPWIANADPASQQSSLAAWARGVRNALPQDSEKDLVRNMCGLSVCGAPSEDAWQRSTGGGGEMPWSGVVDSINFSLWGV